MLVEVEHGFIFAAIANAEIGQFAATPPRDFFPIGVFCQLDGLYYGWIFQSEPACFHAASSSSAQTRMVFAISSAVVSG